MMLSQSAYRAFSILVLYSPKCAAYFWYLGFYSIAVIVLQAALLEDIKLLNATLSKFLSSLESALPLLSKTGLRKFTMSSNRSAYSATLAMNMCSSSDIFLVSKLNLN